MAQAMGMPEAADPMDFITMLDRLQRYCGVSGLRMSDYGIAPEEFGKMAHNARETICLLYTSRSNPGSGGTEQLPVLFRIAALYSVGSVPFFIAPELPRALAGNRV